MNDDVKLKLFLKSNDVSLSAPSEEKKIIKNRILKTPHPIQLSRKQNKISKGAMAVSLASAALLILVFSNLNIKNSSGVGDDEAREFINANYIIDAEEQDEGVLMAQYLALIED